MHSKKILVTGATGLVGQPLCAALKERGYSVHTLSRSEHGDFQWDVEAGFIDPSALKGIDVVIHLAGESVAQRWTDSAKDRILNSRVDSTKLLVEEILRQPTPPSYIAASGISYYGIQSAGLVDEASPCGSGFLAEVTRQWEGAAAALANAGVRTAFLRVGIVLSADGGALAKMIPPFKMGVGGRIGTGQQRMSWISLRDLVEAFVFVVEGDAVCGPINAVAPKPVTNLEFTKTMGAVLRRPTVLPMPAAVIKALFGEMGEETVLSDLGVSPTRLQELGFIWRQPELRSTLKATIEK